MEHVRVAWTVLAAAAAWGADGDFWARTADPGRAAFERAYAEGMERLEAAWQVRGAEQARLLAEAEAALRRAVAASPRRAAGHEALARVLYERDRDEEAVRALSRARDLGGAGFDADGRIAFALGVALSRLGRFEQAVEEYDGVLRGRAEEGRRCVALANAAEALMALGRLSDAIDRYRRAVDLAPALPPGEQPSALLGAWWGLAVALDRDEQIARAEEAARQALLLDPNVDYPGSEGVFFVPPGDVHYYEALGHEVAGRVDPAIVRWRKFLEALPASPWAYRARQRLAELERVRRLEGGGRR